MTNERNFNELNKDLEREALVAIQRIESISLYFKSINEKYGGIPNGELFPHIFEYFWNLLFNQHRIIET